MHFVVCCIDNRCNDTLKYQTKQMSVCVEGYIDVNVFRIQLRTVGYFVQRLVDVQLQGSTDDEVGSSDVKSCWLPKCAE